MMIGKSQPKNFVLGEKSSGSRRARDGQDRNKKSYKRDRHELLEAAHLAHVLLMMHRMDDTAGAEEQTSFEERMGHQVKHRRRIAADTDADKHVAELADGGISQNFFDVGLG